MISANLIVTPQPSCEVRSDASAFESCSEFGGWPIAPHDMTKRDAVLGLPALIRL